MGKVSTPRGRPIVGAIIVTYHPSPQIRDHVAVLRPQVDELVIVDNGSNADERANLENLAGVFRCRSIFNEQNLGLAAALNLGISSIEESACAFVVLFDQDSCVSPEFVASMLSSYRLFSTDLPVALVAPTYIDKKSRVPIPLPTNRKGLVMTTMTSGSFIPLTTIRMCGLFDEAFFVDYVDTEYCLRVQAQGLVIVQSDTAQLFHSLGNLGFHRIAGRNFSVTNHSASRRYYITRNRLFLYRRYLGRSFEWAAWDFRRMLAETVKLILVEDDRPRKIASILRGVRDALFGRSGYQVPL